MDVQYDLTELCHLAAKYGNDRHPLSNKHSYTPFYYKLFGDKKDKIKKVLEIGVGEGAGLRMWRDFFPNATIFGAEIDDSRIFKEEHITVFKCDQASWIQLQELIKKTGKDIDIVVDDASHKTHDQINTCLSLMPLLKKSVTYIIEDVSEPEVVASALKMYNPTMPDLIPMRRKYDNHLIVINKHG